MLPQYAAGELEPGVEAGVREHFAGCADCRQAAADAALDAALARGVPRFQATPAFKQRLREQVRGAGPAPSPVRRPRRWFGAPAAATIAIGALAAALVLVVSGGHRKAADEWTLADEAVSDHLRVAASTHPVEVESGGIHQVKPWFTGRVDFAPRITFSGDADFPMVGGSVGYVRDRRAAVFTFRHKLHLISLVIFPADNLPWPQERPTKIGPLDVVEEDRRGFSVLFWRSGGLGYALVSDVNRADLELLAQRIDPR
jgi:anti-sigma factor RsiW